MEPFLLSGLVPERLHKCDKECQSNVQWNQHEVVDGSDTELPPAEHDRVERCLREGHCARLPSNSSLMDGARSDFGPNKRDYRHVLTCQFSP